MEKIVLKFSAHHCFNVLSNTTVVLTMDEGGKKYSIEVNNMLSGLNAEEVCMEPKKSELPKRVMTAFSENAINKILAKDEIPNESGIMVLDGYNYEITISKGEVTKEYEADDASIETYRLLRYLASWCRKK
jgi:hypothetical protein